MMGMVLAERFRAHERKGRTAGRDSRGRKSLRDPHCTSGTTGLPLGPTREKRRGPGRRRGSLRWEVRR